MELHSQLIIIEMGIDRRAIQGCYQSINSILAMLEKIVDFPYVDAIAYTTLSQQDVYWIGSDQKDKRL